MSDIKRNRHRWLSVVLGPVGLLAAVIALPLVWKMNQVHNQRRVVAELTRLNAEVVYDYQVPAKCCVVDNDPHDPPGPAWLRAVFGNDLFAHVARVIIRDNQPTDDTLALVATLPHLRLLGFQSDRVTDAGLVHVAKLHELEHMKFISESITDEGLLNLKGHKRLKSLGLLMPRLTDRGLATIAQLSQLECLVIRSDKVTDDGLKHLAKLSRLTQLDLFRANVTPAGLTTFKQANAAKIYVNRIAIDTQ